MSLEIHMARLATPQTTLVAGLNLNIAPGTVHTLMGESGSGKSSVLAALCGTLDDALTFEGTVHLGGLRIDTLPTQARRVGILFQDDLLFALPQGVQAQREAQVRQALVDVEMSAYLHADPATLSGGQRARAALARALLAQPRALLLDEPFSRLDAALRARMRALVWGLVQARHIPALLVTHDSADVADTTRLTVLPQRGQ